MPGWRDAGRDVAAQEDNAGRLGWITLRVIMRAELGILYAAAGRIWCAGVGSARDSSFDGRFRWLVLYSGKWAWTKCLDVILRTAGGITFGSLAWLLEFVGVQEEEGSDWRL